MVKSDQIESGFAPGGPSRIGGNTASTTYAQILVGTAWVCPLFLFEYTLPRREYLLLRWPSREEYDYYEWRLEDIRRAHLIEGVLSPGSEINILAYGKYVTEDGVLWDLNFETIDVSIRIVTFHIIHSHSDLIS